MKSTHHADLSKFSEETLRYKSDTDAVIQECERKIAEAKKQNLIELEKGTDDTRLRIFGPKPLCMPRQLFRALIININFLFSSPPDPPR